MRKYTVLDKLGEGSFANVHRCRNASTSEVVAVKQLKQRFDRWEDCKRLREVRSLSKLKHPNVIRCTEVILEKNRELYLVFEYAPRNLWQLVTDEREPLPASRVRHLLRQLLEGLAYIHQNNFFHRDIKPENLLMVGDALKIADLGLAREIRSRPPYTNYVSTRWYRAPELLLQSGHYSSPIDLWATGCILGEMCLRRNLFPGESDVDMLHVICKRLGTFDRESWSEGVKQLGQRSIKLPQYAPTPLTKWFEGTLLARDADAQQLFLDLLRFDPQARVTAQQALRSGFFVDCAAEADANAAEAAEEAAALSRTELIVSTTTSHGATLTRQHSEVDIDQLLDQLLVSPTKGNDGDGDGEQTAAAGADGDSGEQCANQRVGRAEAGPADDDEAKDGAQCEIQAFLDNLDEVGEHKTIDLALEELLSAPPSRGSARAKRK